MNNVIFKTKNAVFQFELKKVKECLEIMVTECGVEEANTILKQITISTDESKSIQVKHNYFGLIALELIGTGKGCVTCEICGKMFEAQDLKPITSGAEESPFNINKGRERGLESLIGRRKNPSLFGGQILSCPKNHKLIAMETWRT